MIKHLLYPLIILLALTHSAYAHPHAWIDVKSAVLMNDDGNIKGVRVGWLFGDFYTAFAIEGMDQDGDGMPDQDLLDKLAEENLNNLATYNYFVEFMMNGKTQSYQPVTNFDTFLNGSRLWLEFVVPLTTPVDPKDENISYSVFDPTYYVEMLHSKEMPISIEGEGSDTCQYSIKPPTPSDETRLFASSLDATESGGNSLGKLFAETVKISCI